MKPIPSRTGSLFMLLWTMSYETCIGYSVVAALRDRQGVYTRPIITVHPGNGTQINIPESQSLTLSCTVGGHPRAKPRWTLPKVLSSRQIDTNDPVIEVSDIQRYEGGSYICTARNDPASRTQSLTTTINVYYLSPPSMRMYITKSSTPADSMWFETTVIFVCRTYSNPEPTVLWYKGGARISPIANRYKRIEMAIMTPYENGKCTHLLKIFNPGNRQYGNYQCRTTLGTLGRTNGIKDQFANFTFSKDSVKPSIKILNQQKIVLNPGDSIDLICEVTNGKPLPRVYWRKLGDQDRRERYRPPVVTIPDKIVMTLSNVDKLQAGIYICTADNFIGRPINRQVEVIVRYVRQMIFWITPDSLSDDRKLELNKDIKFTCFCEGQPLNEIQYLWYKEDSRKSRTLIECPAQSSNCDISSLSQPDKKKFVTFPATSSVLHIRNAQESDYGTYVCEAGMQRIPQKVNATISITRDSAPSQIFADQHVISIKEGSNADLRCRAAGQPRAKIEWFGNENETLHADRFRITKDGGTLTIHNVSRDDDGTYTCKPLRMNGFSKLAKTNYKAEIELDVLYPPDVQPSNNFRRISMSSPIALACLCISANPDKDIKYEWTKDNHPVSGTSSSINYTNNSKTKYGIYQCRVSNSVGSSYCRYNITGAAYAPEFYYEKEDIMTIKTTTTMRPDMKSPLEFVYVLYWTQKLPYAVDPVIEYRIRWRSTKSSKPMENKFENEDTLHVEKIYAGRLILYEMKNLTPGEYEVEVTPKTQFGFGDSAKRIINARMKKGVQTTYLGSRLLCSFTDGDMCGFIQEPPEEDGGKSFDDFDWIMNDAADPHIWKRTPNTGPSYDHTNMEKGGGYMFIESSYTKLNQRARLVSPIMWVGQDQQQCLKFYYHMWGRDIGMLNVLIRTTKDVSVWSRNGSQGNRWIEGAVPVLENNIYQIVFEAVILKYDGFNYLGDIAIDDVSILDGPCPTPATLLNQSTNSMTNGATNLNSLIHKVLKWGLSRQSYMPCRSLMQYVLTFFVSLYFSLYALC